MLIKKVLIIDDNQSAVNSIHRSLILEENDCEITCTTDGETGLELYYKEQPTLLLLDLNMPVMGGIDFLKKVDLSPDDPCTVIAMSDRSDDENIKRCFDFGVTAFLRKPFNVYEFLGLVKQAIAFRHIQQVLHEQSQQHNMAQQFNDEKSRVLSAIMHKVKRPLIPIVNCTRDLLEGKIKSEEDRIKKLQEIQNASKELVDVFENPYDLSN